MFKLGLNSRSVKISFSFDAIRMSGHIPGESWTSTTELGKSFEVSMALEDVSQATISLIFKLERWPPPYERRYRICIPNKH